MKKDTKHVDCENRDMLTSIKFSIGGWSSKRTCITITKNTTGAEAKIAKGPGYYNPTCETKQITLEKWQKIVDGLYDRAHLNEWKEEYKPEKICVLDGIQWELELKLDDGRVCKYCGSNAYPSYWEKFLKLFEVFV